MAKRMAKPRWISRAANQKAALSLRPRLSLWLLLPPSVPYPLPLPLPVVPTCKPIGRQEAGSGSVPVVAGREEAEGSEAGTEAAAAKGDQ
ncbi:Hypothetical predicted protein [Podarcis lilfordi]|uniref:Uncharacterized protein n=1 Tax=Podarcis lilfordi TaxID=74358 RepID=A0AA35JW92_9SAUR|nr:Hypothetical predicted protein [Podarcis lilfordi]